MSNLSCPNLRGKYNDDKERANSNITVEVRDRANGRRMRYEL